MPVQTRRMICLNQHKQDEDAAITMLNIHKTSVDKKKQELEKLKLIKRYTKEYNIMKHLYDISIREMNSLEMKISELLSSVDK
jgi:hypothetical protein